MKRWLIVLIPAVVLGGLIVWRLGQKNSEAAAQSKQREMRVKAPAVVSVAPAVVRDLVETYETVGSIEAPFNVKLAAKVAGRIDYLEVREGAHVAEGQVLVRIDPSEVEAQVSAARSMAAEARYRLEQASITEVPTDASVRNQIRQQQAALASAEAELKQVTENSASRKAAQEAAITDAAGRVNDAEASIRNAEASVRSAQANVDNARTKLSRITDLYKQNFIAAQDVDDAKTALSVQLAALDVANGELSSATSKRDSMLAQKDSAERQLTIALNVVVSNRAAAQANVNQARAALEYAKANTAQKPAFRRNVEALRAAVSTAEANLRSAEARRSDTILKSPFNGYVTGRFLDPGSTATPGAQILGIQAIKQVWVTFSVAEEVNRKIVLGMPVQFTVDAIPDRKFVARVAQINPSADPNNRQFVIRAAIDNSRQLFKPGMFAHAVIEVARVRGATAVPREAVQTGKDGPYVNVVDDQVDPTGVAHAHVRPVTLGASEAASIQVTTGLQPGEKVITMSANPVKDGAAVRVGGGKKR